MTPGPPPGGEADPFDARAMLDQAGGDRDLLVEVVRLFLAERPGMVAAIRAAAERKDATALHRSAHRLKGALLNLSAGPAGRAALALETMGRGGDLAKAVEGIAALERELDRLDEALREVA